MKDKQGRVVFTSDWKKASAENDFTAQIPVKGLKPGHAYQIELEAKSTASRKVNYESGAFSTAPGKNDKVPVLITTSTCQYFWSFDDKKRGFHTYDSMTKLNPDFFVHTGDYIYYDKPGPLAKNIEKARHKSESKN